MTDLYALFPGMRFPVEVDGDIAEVDLLKPRITPERQQRLHETIRELRVALDTEKQLTELQDAEPQPGNIIKRTVAAVKRRFGRCK